MNVKKRRQTPAPVWKLILPLVLLLASFANQAIAQVPGGTANRVEINPPSNPGSNPLVNPGNQSADAHSVPNQGGTTYGAGSGYTNGNGPTGTSVNSSTVFSWDSLSIAPGQILFFVGAVFGLAFAFLLLIDSSRLQLTAKLGEFGPVLNVLLALALVAGAAALWVFARFTQGHIFYYGGDSYRPAIFESLVVDFAKSPRAYAEAIGVLAIFPTAVALYQFTTLWRAVPEGASLGVLIAKTIVSFVGFVGSIVTLVFTSYHF